MAVKAILFDWDGVLFDVFDFMVAVYQEVMADAGVPVWNREEFRERMRNDWRSVLPDMRLAGAEDRLIAAWDERQTRESISLFDDAYEFITALPADLPLGIVSSAPRQKITDELHRHGLGHVFAAVIAYEDCSKVKPAPDPLLLAAQRLGVDAGDCVYVGDMVDDIQAAKAAGMKSVAVTWGIHPAPRLAKARPDARADDFNELIAILRNIH